VLIPKEHFGIPDSEITLAEALKERGYRTACIGKWHLGSAPRYRPNRHGFDEFYGILYSTDMTLPVVHWPPIRLFRNQVAIESPAKQSTLTQRFTQEALRFIDANKDNPFLLYMPYTMPHLPWAASERFSGHSKHGAYGDAVEELDWSVGEVLRSLEKHRLDDHTIVFFVSDNGPELVAPGPAGSTGGLRGGKGSTWEGGVRVPCIIRQPRTIPTGAVRPGITCLMDVFATCIQLAGVTLPSDYVIDGQSLLSFLKGSVPHQQPPFCYYFGEQLCAFRAGDWKVHLHKRERGPKGRYRAPTPCEPPELYNLTADPAESVNVYAEQPQVALSLAQAAADYETAIKAGKRAPPRWRSLLPPMRRRKP
jgi:arylsulfatase A-like enzyme